MITYLDIINVEDIKTFLRVQGNDFDPVIEGYIITAFKMFEAKTNHYTATQTREYKAGTRYYDYPISDYTDVVSNGLYFTPTCDVTLDRGYTDVIDVPEDIKFAVKKIVEGMYLAEEQNEPFKIKESMAMEVIKDYKRFFI